MTLNWEEGYVKQIDCQEAERRLHTFLERELDKEEMAEVQAHLDDCRECHSKFRFEASFKRLIMARSSEQRAPTGLRERLAERLRQQRGERRSRDDK